MWCCSAYLTNAICYNVISLEGARIWIQYIIYSNHVLKYWTTPLAPRIVFKIMKVIAFMQIVAPCSLVSSFLFKLLSSCCSQALFLVLELPGQWLQFLPASHMHFRKDERTAIGTFYSVLKAEACNPARHWLIAIPAAVFPELSEMGKLSLETGSCSGSQGLCMRPPRDVTPFLKSIILVVQSERKNLSVSLEYLHSCQDGCATVMVLQPWSTGCVLWSVSPGYISQYLPGSIC